MLEARKASLKSQATYEKSLKAVKKLNTGMVDNSSKIDIAIKYLLSICEDITPLALQKALYYIQGFYYAFYDTFIFSEDCEAWAQGPVYRDIYFRYRDYHFDPILENPAFDSCNLTASEKALFDSVINNFCCYSGKILERFTHSEMPWIDAREGLPLHASSNQTIPKESIGEYFVTVKAKYNMVKPNNIKMYAMDMFENT